jgi:hypothetical protein
MTKVRPNTGVIGALFFLLAVFLIENVMARAADANVIEVRAMKGSNSYWTFHVTVSHPDTGWDDYCDGWDVVTDAGEVLKRNPKDPFTRLLLHPHENEQPFTRSQSGLTIPEGVKSVTVRAHDIVDGYGGHEIELDLTADSGPGYTISK